MCQHRALQRYILEVTAWNSRQISVRVRCGWGKISPRVLKRLNTFIRLHLYLNYVQPAALRQMLTLRLEGDVVSVTGISWKLIKKEKKRFHKLKYSRGHCFPGNVLWDTTSAPSNSPWCRRARHSTPNCKPVRVILLTVNHFQVYQVQIWLLSLWSLLFLYFLYRKLLIGVLLCWHHKPLLQCNKSESMIYCFKPRL